jgi:hypothetical protein
MLVDVMLSHLMLVDPLLGHLLGTELKHLGGLMVDESDRLKQAHVKGLTEVELVT